MSVFATDTSKPTVIRAGKATVTCNGIILLATNVTVSYQRPVEVVPTVGNKRVISIGEGVGQFSAETIVAKDNDALNALRLNDDGCDPFTMTLTFNDNACDMNGKSVTCHNCVSSAISITAQGGRGYIGQGVQVTFTALTLM
jgi:hypothetical protein